MFIFIRELFVLLGEYKKSLIRSYYVSRVLFVV
jgi:hypothetical protein